MPSAKKRPLIEQIFGPINKRWYPNREAFLQTVYRRSNLLRDRDPSLFPIGFSPMDAVEAARQRGWLLTTNPTGVAVAMKPEREVAALS